jgi:hypothetical protein
MQSCCGLPEIERSPVLRITSSGCSLQQQKMSKREHSVTGGQIIGVFCGAGFLKPFQDNFDPQHRATIFSHTPILKQFLPACPTRLKADVNS